MGSIKIEKLEKWFGAHRILKQIDLQVADGELVVFVGPSGCGKSTLLRVIAGLEEADQGRIFLDQKDISAVPPYERNFSMVFQSYALYPHLSVSENIGFPLKTLGVPKQEITDKIKEIAKILKLDHLLQRRPKDLSGGQRQRVAIGRAIAREPRVFLFDEPLSNLDAAFRIEMRFEIARLHQVLENTMIYVTHDQVEAMTLADRIFVLREGAIEQSGSPRELYQKPENIFVAQFIGSPKMNLISGKLEGRIFYLTKLISGLTEKPGIQLKQPPKKSVDQLGVRPEHIMVVPSDQGDFQARVEIVEYLGADLLLYLNLFREQIIVRTDGTQFFKPGDEVGLKFDPDQFHFFDREGSRVD